MFMIQGAAPTPVSTAPAIAEAVTETSQLLRPTIRAKLLLCGAVRSTVTSAPADLSATLTLTAVAPPSV